MKLKTLHLLLVVFLLISTNSKAQVYTYENPPENTGIEVKATSPSGLDLTFDMVSFTLSDLEVDGRMMKHIQIDGAFLPNNAGAPDLPAFSRMVAVPQGGQAVLRIKSYREEIITSVDIAPAPRIPLDTERGPLDFSLNTKVYSSNDFYPAEPFQLSGQTQIRGLDVMMLSISPFQYNPVSKVLKVFRDIEMEIVYKGGTGHFGDDRLRNRWWDQIISASVLNPQQLPVLNFDEPRSPSDTPDYEYLIITPNDPVFLAWADSIRIFRTLQGINTGVVTTTEIGGNTVSAIENYVDNAYNSWAVPPVAVLLLGDYSTGAGGIISHLYAHPSSSYPDYASDNRYADVNGNDLPDIVFARITANNAAQLEVMITKFLDYERNPPTNPNFYDHPITALGWQTERWFQICSEVVGGYLKNEQGKNPVRINAVYDGNPSSDPWSTATNTSTVLNYFGPNGLGYIPATPNELGGFSGGTAAQVVNAINNGSYLLQHRDHGYYGGWGEPAFNTSSISSLHNVNNELPFIFSINCQTGAFHRSAESFAEKFHRYTYNGQNSGALGILAATEVSYSFVNDVYVWGVFDNMHPDFMPGYSATFPTNYVLPAFGNAAGKNFLYQSSWPYNSGSKQVTYRLFHHHGDAFMTLFTEVPQNLAVNHNAVLLSGETSFTVTANAGSFIALTVDGEIIATAQGTGQAVNIPIAAQAPPAELTVTVTKQNYRRYQAAVEILPPGGPYVVFDQVEVNDYTDNNGNGKVDYGETIWLTMTLKNLGTEEAANVSATISTNDAYTSIIQNTAFFGDIPAGQSLTITDAYQFEVSQDIPDQHSIVFLLTASNAGKENWNSYFNLTANAPALDFAQYIVNDASGNGNGILDPGETAPVQIFIKNNGGAAASGVLGQLSTSDAYLSIQTTSSQNFGTLGSGQSASASFTISAEADIPGGHIADAILNITANNGITQEASLQFNFTDYCYPTANCSYSDGFTGFALGDISNMNSGCSPNGYGDFLDMSTELEAGETYTVQWKTGYSNQDASLWIDLNSNREFESNERLITDFNLATAGTVYSVNFTLPEEVYPGTKRMRIRANWQNSSADPCTNFTYGETEDYTIIIVAPLLPLADFTGEPRLIAEGENVQFTDLSANQPLSWQWDFSGGTPATSSNQNPTISYANAGSYSVKLLVTNAGGTDSETKLNYITVVEVPECAALISPPNNGVDISISTHLQWAAVTAATGYKIFFGTDNPPTNIINGNDLENVLTYNPANDLEYTTTYYWRIVAYNQGAESIGCETWSFTTADEPPPPGHFAPVWTTPSMPMTIYVLEALLEETALEIGDEIGVFDIDPNTGNEICVGAATLSEALGASTFLEIIASADDASFPGQANGFTPGHTMLYKYWKPENGEIHSVRANYPYQGYDEVFTAQGSAFAELSSTALINQSIPLQAGWNMISFSVEPENMDMLNLVQPLIDQDNLFKVVDENGGTIFHLPFPPPNGQWSNTISDMACTEGYCIKVYENTSLETQGVCLELPMQIPLVEGWNIMSYPCAQPAEAMSVVQPLIDAGALFKVVDENGGTIFHLPFPPPNGQWSNTIGNFENGEGYYIKVNQDITLSVDEPARNHVLNKTIDILDPIYFTPCWQGNPYLPMHVVIEPTEMLAPGDELAVFDGELCVGSLLCPDDPTQPFIITCAADDPDTELMDGFISGHDYRVEVWKQNQNLVYPDVGYSLIEGSAVFAQLATAVLSLDDFLTGISEMDQGIISLDIYPNPVNNQANIVFNISENGNVKLEICDLYGNVLSEVSNAIYSPGEHGFQVSMDHFSSGYYLLKYSFSNSEINTDHYQKFIIIK